MTPKTRNAHFAAPFALAALLSLPALLAVPARSFAQDDGGAGGGGAGEEAKPAAAEPAKPKVEEAPPEVKGNRFRVTLKSGAKIEGLLPQGILWEKRDQMGEFVEASETEKGAGLRISYVLNMEGDIFVQKKDIAEVKDLGALTDEQKLAIQEMVLTARKKNLAEREKINREEMAKIGAAAREAEAKEAEGEGEGDGKKDPEAARAAAKAAKDRKRGDALLAKFPSDQWGAKRIEEIQHRSVINGIFPSTDEQEFIDNFDLWKEAVARHDKEEADRKAGGGEGGGDGDAGGTGGGEGSGDAGSGGKKETPPETGKKKGMEKVPPAEFKKKGE